jgi:lipoate-protein ligase A
MANSAVNAGLKINAHSQTLISSHTGIMNQIPVSNSNLEIICSSAPTVARNLDLDDAAVRTASETGRHSLRFWWGGPPAVVVGFSEKIDRAVNADACRMLGVDVLRRSTGGGSVLQTAGVFNYSFVRPLDRLLDPRRAFRSGTDLIVAVLNSLGLDGKTEGISDVVVGKRKISGNAQAQRRKALIVHGTLLVDFDYDLAEKVLRYPKREPAYRQGRSHREFLICLRELGIDSHDIEQKAIVAARSVYGNSKTAAA